MATTSTTAATTTGATASIVKTLGSGSGLDSAAIVAALVQAQFATRNQQLSRQADALTAKISGVAKLRNGITGFDTALRTLVKGGSLATQPTSSAAGVLAVSALPGARLSGLDARVTVNRLASAQAATTNTAVDRAAAFRTGVLTVTTGGTAHAIAIGAGDATLDGVAARINAAALGVTASVVTDAGGARLTFKGQTGAANAFTIDAADDDATAPGMSLSGLAVGAAATGATIGAAAADAEVVLDGATYHRAVNTISDLLPGVRLQLQGTGAAKLGVTPPTANIAQAVGDFVDTYNQLQATLTAELDAKTGDLHGDAVAQSLQRALGRLTTTSLAASTAAGAPRTLADLGVQTNRDGTLKVDTGTLNAVLTRYPDAAEAMLADGAGAADGGLSAALAAIAARATDPAAGFGAEAGRFTSQQTGIAAQQGKAGTDAAAMSDRLTQQFATMDARVAAYKSTQDFLKQQVDAWYAQK